VYNQNNLNLICIDSESRVPKNIFNSFYIFGY
jgi:hypothetical protein